jgi:hypothetical protein
MHPGHLEKYNELTSAARKRKTNQSQDLPEKRTRQPAISDSFSNANLVSQATIDKLVTNLIVQNVLPLALVEKKEFKLLITGLQPNKTTMKRSTLRSRIKAKHDQMMAKLKEILKRQSHVSTTTDCWSAYGKSYIGVTVHWIDQQTLERRSACLALRRMKGSHTYDAIAAELHDIHSKFGIKRKIVKTTTDNGSNFVKAFSVFGVGDSENLDTDDSEEENDEDEDDSHQGTHEMQEDELQDPVNGFDVHHAICQHDDDEDEIYQLPRHQRCACHTLNLIATTDADKAEADAHYKKISRSAFAKCQALWNKYGRSTHAADTVRDALKLGLKRPNKTRWNSVFMAVERINKLVSDLDEETFQTVCVDLDVPRLSVAELSFLSDYASVMKPLAQALNILQAETKMYFGYLLPTITRLRQKLIAMKNNTLPTVCRPLITALVNGIDQRFADIFQDKEAIVAAILHPKFRTTWTTDEALIRGGIERINETIERLPTTLPQLPQTSQPAQQISECNTLSVIGVGGALLAA